MRRLLNGRAVSWFWSEKARDDIVVKLYFVRHGESTANLLNEFSNSNDGRPLTEVGLEQARVLAGALSGEKFFRIYSSPLLRARQTARILAGALHAPVEIREALREWSVGIYEGTCDPAGWELHRQVQAQWFEQGQIDSHMPGGESLRQIHARFIPFIEGLAAEYAMSDQRLLLVAHGGLYLAALPFIFKNLDIAFARRCGFPYTGFVTAEGRPEGLCCLSWCGIALEA